jgi:hypothetical protein
MLFIVMVERAAEDRRPPSSLATVCALAILLGLGFVSVGALAAESLAADAVIRVSSDAVEHGWHQGRAVLDARKCWMVQLDRPTQDGHTMLALSFVKSIEVQRSGAWSPLALQTVIANQPKQCLEEGTD